MAAACGVVTITTGAVGTTFTISGLPFTPTAFYFAWSGRATVGFAEEDHKFGQGIAVSTTSRRAYGSQADHGNTTMSTDRVRSADCCIITQGITGTVTGKVDMDAVTSDGCRLIVDTQLAAALQVGWLAVDAADAEIVDIAEPGATGDQSYATAFALNTGIDDKAVIIIGASSNTTETPVGGSEYCLGVLAGNTPVGAVLTGECRDAQASAVSSDYCRTGECISIVAIGGSTVVVRASGAATTWLSTGFALNWAEVDAGFAWQFSALVIKGGRYTVGDAVTRTDTTQQTEATGYTPEAILVLSACKAVCASDTPSNSADERSVGVAVSSTSRWCASVHDKDAAAIADIGVGFHDDRFYNNISLDAAMVVEGAADLVSFDATPQFTYVMDDADPVAAYFGYLAFGSATVAAASLLPPPRPMRHHILR